MKINNQVNNRHFQNVGALHPERSAFDLSYSKTFDCDMGQLIPVMCDEVVPGDFFKIGCEAVIRFNPLVAPILHEVNMYVHYFFVPYRLITVSGGSQGDNLRGISCWEEYITGGIDGNGDGVVLSNALPRFFQAHNSDGSGSAKGTLYDYFGFPTGVIWDSGNDDTVPLAFPWRAYNAVYNAFYRDESLQLPVYLDNNTVLHRNWEKDYFTSSLLSQQRGTAPALPLSGHTNAYWDLSQFNIAGGQSPLTFNGTNSDPRGMLATSMGVQNAITFLNNNVVNFANAGTFNVADVRLAFQIQKWMERNNRAGARYTEFLQAHFGVSPRDERLQRPEYIGGTKAPVIFSEVLQTSSTDAITPQGNMAGHGLSVQQAFCGSYHAKEFGCIIGIMSIMPRSMYQNGIDRQWLRRSKYDFYFREFANLSEQAVERGEIFTRNTDALNKEIFGYAGRYDEMRVKKNMVCGNMRDTFKYWHLGRQFATPPALNSDFITCNVRKDIFAAPSVPGLIVSFGNKIKALRPLPVVAEPGMIDHY